jgi:Replication-relaxation
MDMLAAQIRSVQAVRRRRFHRSEPTQPMRLTARDLALLAYVAEYRFLTSAQLAALDGGSEQNVLRRLRELFDHGCLDRPRAQIAAIMDDGPQPLVYGLAKKGARALRLHGHRINANLDWTEKNKRAGLVFIEHTLGIADFLVRLEVACRRTLGIEIIREHEIIDSAPEETRRAREPLRWKIERVQHGRKETSSVVPDGLFGLSFPDETASYYLLEIDRSTIPLRRTDTVGTAAWRKNIAFKLATYYDGWLAGRHVAQLGLKQVRVLMLTTTEARMKNMLAVLDEITAGVGTGFVLFGHTDALAASNPLTMPWVNGRRESIRLID